MSRANDRHGGLNVIDMTGQRFGRLVVIERSPHKHPRGALWKCLCDCGNPIQLVGTQLRHGSHKSCGCLKDEVIASYVQRQKLLFKDSKLWAGSSPVIRNKAVAFKLSEYEHAEIKRVADAVGVTMADFVRNAALTFAKQAEGGAE